MNRLAKVKWIIFIYTLYFITILFINLFIAIELYNISFFPKMLSRDVQSLIIYLYFLSFIECTIIAVLLKESKIMNILTNTIFILSFSTVTNLLINIILCFLATQLSILILFFVIFIIPLSNSLSFLITSIFYSSFIYNNDEHRKLQ